MNPEEPLCIESQGERLIGVLHRPQTPGNLTRGVVVVVGGPQYRIGSHRQFVLLARSLAARGTPVLRFDLAGMGDSGGEFAGFERSAADIRAAIDALQHGGAQRARRVSLGTLRWRIGRADVCPAGSAGVAPGAGESLGAHERGPGAGVSRRLLRPQAPQPGFWRRMAGDPSAVLKAAGGFLSNLRLARQAPEEDVEINEDDEHFLETDARRRQRLQGPHARCS